MKKVDTGATKGLIKPKKTPKAREAEGRAENSLLRLQQGLGNRALGALLDGGLQRQPEEEEEPQRQEEEPEEEEEEPLQGKPNLQAQEEVQTKSPEGEEEEEAGEEEEFEEEALQGKADLQRQEEEPEEEEEEPVQGKPDLQAQEEVQTKSPEGEEEEEAGEEEEFEEEALQGKADQAQGEGQAPIQRAPGGGARMEAQAGLFYRAVGLPLQKAQKEAQARQWSKVMLSLADASTGLSDSAKGLDLPAKAAGEIPTMQNNLSFTMGEADGAINRGKGVVGSVKTIISQANGIIEAMRKPSGQAGGPQKREDEEAMQGKEQGSAVSRQVMGAIDAQRGGGQGLPPEVREQAEAGLGFDFRDVRVHTDSEADGLARGLRAKAFTTGKDVFFRSENYDPHSAAGRELIGHELTHVVQQHQGLSEPAGRPGDRYEQEADQVGAAFARQPATVAGIQGKAAGPTLQADLQRQSEPEEEEEVQPQVQTQEEIPEEEV